MQVSILIVTYQAVSHIAECLVSIQQHTRDITYEVIVADNHSSDGTVELLRTRFPWVHVIQNEKNLGFGTANNRAAALASGEILFFLNDDTVLTENVVKKGYDRMRVEPDIGCLGLHLVFPDGSHQDSVRAYPGLRDQAMILLKLHHLFPRAKALRRYLCTGFDYAHEHDVDQVMGACMMIPKTIFEQVGGFDERFFLWFEEVDLQKRIREDGLKRIVYTPVAKLVHKKGTTFGKNFSMRNQLYFNDSLRKYMKKHGSLYERSVIAVCTYVALVMSWVIFSLQRFGIGVHKKNSI